MKKREYPLFMIDRSRSAKYPSDFITCLDREVGFVAQVLHLPNADVWREFLAAFRQIEHPELTGFALPFKTGGVVLRVLEFLYEFEVSTETKNRVQVLLKKGLKKYLHAEVERTPAGDRGLENQIRQQQLTLERAEQNYEDLLARANGSHEIADHQIALQRETIESLKRLKHLQRFFNSGLGLNLNDDEN